MVKYWFRLITLPSDSLASHCYWSLINCDIKNDPWLNSVESLINSTGQNFVWAQQKSISTESKWNLRKHELYICQTLKDLAFQKSNENMGKETKLSFLHTSKSSNVPAKYLNSIVLRKNRSLFSKLRLGTLDLEIEKGRRHKIPRAERFCKLCNSGEVEDTAHFILKCEKLSNCRDNVLKKLSLSNKTFGSLSPELKIKYLYFNENLNEVTLEIASDLLSCLKDSRDSVILATS